MSPRSDRFREAVASLDEFRRHRAVTATPDLFTAIASVADHEGKLWRAKALEALETAALTHREFTIEDVSWPAALDNRARGAVLLEAVRLRWITALGWVSGGQGRHGRPVRLWASRLYRSGDDAA